MDLTKSPRTVFRGNPVLFSHQPVPSEIETLLDEMIAGLPSASISEMVADVNLRNGQVRVVNGEPFLIDTSSPYTANGDTVRTLTGISGQAISLRTSMTAAEFDDDRRPQGWFADGTKIELTDKGGTLEADSTLVPADASNAAGAKFKVIPRNGVAPLAAFRAVLDGATDDSTIIEHVFDIAAARGIKKVLVDGPCAWGDVARTSEALDLEWHFLGSAKLNGTDRLALLDNCTGRAAFLFEEIDGDGIASLDHLIRSTNDAGLHFDVQIKKTVNCGDSGTDSRIKGIFRVENASGRFHDSVLEDVYSRFGQHVVTGYGNMTIERCEFRRGDGNFIRVGRVGSGARSPCLASLDKCYFNDCDDSGDGSGQYGNFISVYQAEDAKLTMLSGETCYASFVRLNAASAHLDQFNFKDSALVSLYYEFGSAEATIGQGKIEGCGTQGVSFANPDDIPSDKFKHMVISGGLIVKRVGYMQTYSERALAASFVGGEGTSYILPTTLSDWGNSVSYTAGDCRKDSADETLWRCAVTHTSHVSDSFAADRSNNPAYWVETFAGRNNAHAIQLNVGLCGDAIAYDVNACTLQGSAAFSFGAQNFGYQAEFHDCYAEGVDYLLAYGASSSKTRRVTADNIKGLYRIAPLVKNLSGYTKEAVTTGSRGQGDDVLLTNIEVPRSLFPRDLHPGSRLINSDTGHHITFSGSSATSGFWSDQWREDNAATRTLDMNDFAVDVVSIYYNSGTAVRTIPDTVSVDLPKGIPVLFRNPHPTNSVTFNASGSDTIGGGTTKSLPAGKTARIARTPYAPTSFSFDIIT